MIKVEQKSTKELIEQGSVHFDYTSTKGKKKQATAECLNFSL